MPLSLEELAQRRATCTSNKCGQWNSTCLKGHRMTGDEACPLDHFKASVYKQRGPTVQPTSQLTWSDVLVDFSRSMANWATSGFTLASAELHFSRFARCQSNGCGRYSGYRCLDCGCVAYAKAKLKNEKCPRNLW